jgi:SAM-dependent methyltransferase
LKLWQHFYLSNPLATFEPDSDDLQGWRFDSPAFQSVLDDVRPKTIIEVGSWKGASAVHMAALAPEADILCIDTWLGSVEAYYPLTLTQRIHKSLRLRDGWPQLYYTFASNIVRHVGRERVCPLALPSSVAAELLRVKAFVADVVYIDGSHKYRDVKRDLEDYFPLVRPGGILFGDDYDNAEVRRAVEEVFPCEDEYRTIGEKFIVRKLP